MNLIILIQLLLAHILTDFVFQSNKCVKEKNDNGYASYHLWVHSALAGLLTYIILQQWTNWQVPLMIIVSHFFIDLWKIKQEQKIGEDKPVTHLFFWDQLFHVLALMFVWLYIIDGYQKVLPFFTENINNVKSIAVITAIIFIIWPAGFIVGKLTESFSKQLPSNISLKKAGLYIGIFERLLVFIFIIINQATAIGFLIAGKSMLRISTKTEDEDGLKKTEYVLIGTLISFFIAIVVGLLTLYVINDFQLIMNNKSLITNH